MRASTVVSCEFEPHHPPFRELVNAMEAVAARGELAWSVRYAVEWWRRWTGGEELAGAQEGAAGGRGRLSDGTMLVDLCAQDAS